MKELIKETDEEDLGLVDDFEARKDILKMLNYIDKDNVALIKGNKFIKLCQTRFLKIIFNYHVARVAREISENEIYLCEVLMENILDTLSPASLGAILSVDYIIKSRKYRSKK
jgi:superfamily II RNA helicase